MTRKERAIYYAKRGYAVFPVGAGKDKKAPLTYNGVKDATTDIAQIDAWASQYPDANWAMACGAITVVDIDPRHGGEHSIRHLAQRYGKPGDTVTVKTGGNGFHFYFSTPEGVIKNRAIAPGVDVKTLGGYVLIPGSFTEGPYEFVDGRDFDSVEIAELPGWIVSLAGAGGQKFEQDENGKIGSGQRNSYLTSLGGAMRRKGFGRDSILAALQVENAVKLSPPVTQDELEHVADSVSRYEPEDPFLKAEDEIDFDLRLQAANSERVITGYIIGGYDKKKVYVSDIFGVITDTVFFADERLRKVYHAARELWGKNTSITPENVFKVLEALGESFTVEDLRKIAEAGSQVVYDGDIEFHTSQILDAYILRESSYIFQHGMDIAKSAKQNPTELVSTVTDRLLKLMDTSGGKALVDTNQMMDQFSSMLEDAKEGKLAMNEPTGFAAIDKAIIGLPVGEVTVIAARPSQGKTAFLLQMMYAMSKRWKEDDEVDAVSLFFSAEMSALQLGTRTVAREGRVDSMRIRKYSLTDEEERKVQQTMMKIRKELNILIDETPNPSPQYMMAKAMAVASMRNLKLVAFDFLELVSDDVKTRGRKGDKVQLMEEAMVKLKSIAKLLNIPVIVLVQLSREVESRSTVNQAPSPRLSDLRWSGMIEQLANVVMGLYYPWFFFNGGIPFKEVPAEDAYEVHLLKGRDGNVGTIIMRFLKQYGFFEEVVIDDAIPLADLADEYFTEDDE